MKHVVVNFPRSSRNYTYRIPDDFKWKLAKGDKVLVPGNSMKPEPSVATVVKVELGYVEDKHINYVSILDKIVEQEYSIGESKESQAEQYHNHVECKDELFY